jgi:hypothetical protein
VLCQARPKWSRRGFLTLLGAGAAGLVLADTLPLLSGEEAFEARFIIKGEYATIDSILKQHYEPYITAQLNQGTTLKRMFEAEASKWDDSEGPILTRRNDGTNRNDTRVLQAQSLRGHLRRRNGAPRR